MGVGGIAAPKLGGKRCDRRNRPAVPIRAAPGPRMDTIRRMRKAKRIRPDQETVPRILTALLLLSAALAVQAADLADVKAAGVLRHIGVPYANFITGSGDGMDVELMQKFAASLGVKYQYIEGDWATLFTDLTGRKLAVHGNEVEDQGAAPVKADVAANGITRLPWRMKVVDFSSPTFPTQVWLLARKDSPVVPIKPSGNLSADIAAVKARMAERTIFCKANTCLAPELYDLDKTGSKSTLFKGSLNELAPAVIKGESELTLLDVPDTLVALRKWPSELKVIGPVGPVQDMAVAFPKEAPALRAAFNEFLAQCQADGTYRQLVEKYYPYAFVYFPDFFARMQSAPVPSPTSHEAGK